MDNAAHDRQGLDLSLIERNPFEYRNPEQSGTLLQWAVTMLADFFGDSASPEDLIRAWNRYQSRCGDEAVIQLAFSVRSLAKIRNIVRALRDAGASATASDAMALVVLFGIALLEFIEGGDHREFPIWLACRLRDEATFPLPSAIDAPSVAAYIEERREAYVAAHGAAESLRRALTEGLSTKLQSRLLSGFTFSGPVRTPASTVEFRHIHCKADGRSEACSVSCSAPTDIVAATRNLATRFYQMRSAFVHQCSYVRFGAEPESVLTDAFRRGDNWIWYRSSIPSDELSEILRKCAWNRLAADR